MKNTKLIFLLFFLPLFFSCSQLGDSSDLLSIKENENGRVDVIDSKSGDLLIKDLTASVVDASNKEFVLPTNGSKPESNLFSDKMGTGTASVFSYSSEEDNLNMKWIIRTFSDKPVIACKIQVENVGKESARIERLNPILSSSEGGIAFKSKDNLQYLDIIPETWKPKAMKNLDKKGESKFITGIAAPDNEGAVIGCISVDRFRGFFEFEDKRDESGFLSFNTWHDVDPHLLIEPNDTLSSEWIYIDCVNDILTGLEQWAELTGSLNGAVISNPAATGFYTWYYYRDYVSEKIMMDNTKFLAENRDKFPVNFVHIDWGWQRKYSSGDTIANEKFPKGLHWLATQIKDHGFTPSIWCNPFMHTYPTAEAVIHNPDIFRKDTAGNLVEFEPIRNIMGNEWGNTMGDATYMVSDGVINTIDVSVPEAYDFLEQRYQWVRSTGFDMAMMDFVIYGRNDYEKGDRLKYSHMSTFEGIHKALTHAKKGLGEGGNILGCGTIYEPSIGVSNLTRVSYDATANWKCVKIATTDLIIQYYMNNKLWTNYADGLFLRDKASPYWGLWELDENGNKFPMYLNDDEAQFYAAVNGLTQAAVMYTEDVQLLKADRQWLLSMVLPIYQEGKFRPLDLFKTTSPKTLQLECEEGNRKWIVAAGLNWTDEVDENGLVLSLLSLEEETQYHAFSVFEKKYLGRVDNSMKIGSVNPHGVKLVNLVQKKDHPQVVGTDMHISQGGIEIDNESWDGNSKTLNIKLNSLFGRKGHIYVQVPQTFSLTPDSHQDIQISNEGVAKIPVTLDDEKTIQVKFQ